ncbi:MAG: hypothetical protein AAGA57_02365 [Planctomycetota bacterium]
MTLDGRPTPRRTPTDEAAPPAGYLDSAAVGQEVNLDVAQAEDVPLLGRG